MSSPTRAFATVDRGTGSTAVALIGRVGGRHRLLGATAGPAGVPVEALLDRVRRRVAAGDPELAEILGLEAPGSAVDLPRLECATTPPPEIAVIAATARVVAPLAAVAHRSGWRVRELVIDGADILKVATSLADRRVDAILAGASEPPGADERSLVGELGTIVAATTDRRPDLVTVLAGGLATPGGRIEALFRPERPGPTLLAPSPAVDGGEPLRALLESLRGGQRDGRRALADAVGTLARVLRRRIEVLEVGQSAGSRIHATWQPGTKPFVQIACVAQAALLPRPFTDADLDGVIGWLTVPLDRLRTRDRLREMASTPWGGIAGDGAALRLAAARAAATRLVAHTPAFGHLPAPDLVLASGGAWLAPPASAVALALADILRRPGSRALGLDHARILAPIGTLEDDEARARLLAELRDDLLVPLGTVVQVGSLKPRSAGALTLHAAGGSIALDLAPGGLELMDVPPGERATAELQFRDAVDLGVHARHLRVEVMGGLAGLLVDLRDTPLRLPDRLEPRRELLAGWQAPMWPGLEP